MRYHNITKDDMLNGDGLRVVLWVAGCNHCCRECQNPITWDPNGGLPFTEKEETEIFTELDKDYVSGITFSEKSGKNIPGRRSGYIQVLYGKRFRMRKSSVIWTYV